MSDLVIKGDTLALIEASGDPEYEEARRLVESVFQERSQRIRLYLVAAAHKKIDDVEKLRDMLDRLEKRVSSNIEQLSPEEALDAMKLMIEVQANHVAEIQKMMEMFSKL